MLRGNGGQLIFADDIDREHFCDLVADGIARFGHRVHAFCLMGNHVHLAVEVGDVTLSRIVQNLAFRYTRLFNRRAGRTGHLFQGRFRSLLVDRDRYLLGLVRYIHSNPVRSGLVRTPEEWAWSSHRVYLGTSTCPWLTTNLILGMVGGGDARLARRHYAAFVAKGLGEGKREEFDIDMALRSVPSGQVRLDSPSLSRGRDTAAVVVPQLDAVMAAVCEVFGLRLAELEAPGRTRRTAEARAMVGWLAQELGTATLTHVAQAFRRDVATLSRQVTSMRARLIRGEDPSKVAGRLRVLLSAPSGSGWCEAAPAVPRT